MNKTQQLEKVSVYAGIRFDLVQAGGGNSSVKLDEQAMLVKASGINLSQLTRDTGYVEVDYHAIRDAFKNLDVSRANIPAPDEQNPDERTPDEQTWDQKAREQYGNTLLANVTKSTQGKPSIETFLHALLNTHTLHTHPLSVNVIACQENWQTVFLDIFPDAVCVPYATPGMDLALSLYKVLDSHKPLPKIVFLQNHGLIISCDDSEEVIALTQSVTDTLNQRVGLDCQRYQAVTPLQQLLSPYSATAPIVYCSDDGIITELLSVESTATSSALAIWPFCPDTLIYCGVAPVFINALNDKETIKAYVDKTGELPKVVVFNQQVYFVSVSLKKAKEAEDLMKFHLLVMSKTTQVVNRLAIDEVAYLSNWDAEKYRQGV